MKHLLLSVFFISSFLAAQRVPCENGMAGEFPCEDYDLMSQISVSTLSATATAANDSWGWTDPNTGKEYALIGLTDGTAFIDISDAENPVHVGTLPTQTVPSSWRDVKVFENNAYIVSEAMGHGMQVFDLTQLEDVVVPPMTFSANAVNTSFGSAHNIIINEDSGYAYPVGARNLAGTARLFGGGPIFIDINGVASGATPSGFNEGGYNATDDNAADGYSHDAQVVTYNGPDTEHVGKEILIGSNQEIITIVNISDKANPVLLSTISYNQVGYTHQGWFTEDQRYFILGDETDERDFGFPTRTLVFDFNDLDNPAFEYQYDGPTDAIDHNGYVLGDNFYMANYNAGMRVLEIVRTGSGDTENYGMIEVGSFDSRPESDTAGFNGAWNVYPYFASGNIVISDIDRGFLLVKQSEVLGTPDLEGIDNAFQISPNPTNGDIRLSASMPIEKAEIFDILGKRIMLIENPEASVDLSILESGVYLLTVNDNLTRKFVKN